MEGYKIWDIWLRATSEHVWSVLFSYVCFFLCSFIVQCVQSYKQQPLERFWKYYWFLSHVRYQCKQIKLLCYSLYFHILEFRVKNESQEEKKLWWCWIGKEETKRKCEVVESPFCNIHSPTVSGHGNFTSLDGGKDTPQKKLESLHKVRDVRLLEDVESTKRMQDVCDLIPESVEGIKQMQDVCNLIPESIEGLDTVKTGWHWGCYQKFTKNLDWLKPAVELSYPTSPKPCLALVSSEVEGTCGSDVRHFGLFSFTSWKKCNCMVPTSYYRPSSWYGNIISQVNLNCI